MRKFLILFLMVFLGLNMAQIAYPDGDISVGSWSPYPSSPTTLFDKIDEVTHDSDVTYIVSSTDEDVCEVSLTDVTDPAVGTGHIIRCYARSVAGAGAGEQFDISLIENGNVRAVSGTFNASKTGYALCEYTLTEAEANSIGNYANLRIRIHISKTDADEPIRITQAEFECPTAIEDKSLVCDSGTFAVTGTIVSLEYNRIIPIGTDSYILTGQDVTLTKGAAEYNYGDTTNTTTDVISVDWIYHFKLTVGNPGGTLTKITFYIGSDITGPTAIKAAVYTHDVGRDEPNELVVGSESEEKASLTPNSWNVFTVIDGPTLSQDTIYWISIWTDGSGGYDGPKDTVGSSIKWAYQAEAYGSWPTPINPVGQADRAGGAYLTVQAELGYEIPIGEGSFAWNGQTVDLLKDREIDIGIDSYALTGQPINLEYNRIIPIGTDSYALTGSDVTLTKEAAKTIIIGSGTFDVVGQIIDLLKDSKVDVGIDSYVLSGQAANLEYDRILGVETDSFTFTPYSATLIYTEEKKISIGAGSFVVAGQTLNLLHDKKVTISAGDYTVTGQVVGLFRDYTIAIEVGNYTESGQIVLLIKLSEINTDGDSFAVTGQVVGLYYDKEIDAGLGEYILTGSDVELTYSGGYEIVIEPGSFAYNGQPIGVFCDRKLLVDSDSYIVTGKTIGFIKESKIVPFVGSFVLVGKDIDFRRAFPSAVFDVRALRGHIKNKRGRERVFDIRALREGQE